MDMFQIPGFDIETIPAHPSFLDFDDPDNYWIGTRRFSNDAHLFIVYLGLTYTHNVPLDDKSADTASNTLIEAIEQDTDIVIDRRQWTLLPTTDMREVELFDWDR